MIRAAGAIILLAVGQPAVAETDFGIRTVGGAVRNDERMGFDKPKPAETAKPAAQAVYSSALWPGHQHLPELRP
jgi:hypothetical protein